MELVQFEKGKRKQYFNSRNFKVSIKINCKVQKEWPDTLDFKK